MIRQAVICTACEYVIADQCEIQYVCPECGSTELRLTRGTMLRSGCPRWAQLFWIGGAMLLVVTSGLGAMSWLVVTWYLGRIPFQYERAGLVPVASWLYDGFQLMLYTIPFLVVLQLLYLVVFVTGRRAQKLIVMCGKWVAINCAMWLFIILCYIMNPWLIVDWLV